MSGRFNSKKLPRTASRACQHDCEKQGLTVKITLYPKSASGIIAFITGKPSKILHCLEGLFNPFFQSYSVATRFFFGCLALFDVV